MQWSRDSRGRLTKLEIIKSVEIVDRPAAPAVDNNCSRSPDIDIIDIESPAAPVVDNYIHTDIDNSGAPAVNISAFHLPTTLLDNDSTTQVKLKFEPNKLTSSTSEPKHSLERLPTGSINLKPILIIDTDDHIVDTTTLVAGPSTTVPTTTPPSGATPSIYRHRIKGGTDSTMANPTPLPTYTGETSVKQDEFIDSLRQLDRTQHRAQRMGHVQWDSVLAACQYMKAEAHRE